MDRTRREGMLFILTAVSGYSFFPVFVSAISATGLGPFDIATWRFVVAVPLIWLVVSLRHPPGGPGRLPRVGLMVSGVLMTAAALTALRALELIPASLFILMFYTYPSIIALTGIFRGERLRRVEWLALAMTLAGIVLIMPDLGSSLNQAANLEGILLAIANSLVVAAQFVVTSSLLRGCNDVSRATAYSTFGALVPLLLLALVRPVEQPSSAAWPLLAGLALFSTVLPIIALNAGIQRLGPSRAAIVSTLEPVLTICWSVLLLGDVLVPVQLVGGALILASVVMLQLRNIRLPAGPIPVLGTDQPAGP